MVLTWTKYVLEHYGTATESLSSHPDEANTQAFPFMRLPVEIRLQVYKEYLAERYRLLPAEIHEMVLDPHHRTKCPAEILQVSKAINAEVTDLLQQETTFYLRICWQDATFDGFVRSCIQARGKRLNYENVRHLKIEIYPPHRDRPTDMVCIWRHVQKLCKDLQKASCLQHISIQFMENEYAAWSLDGEPLDTTKMHDPTFMWSSDILFILDIFPTLTNVTKAQIHLPGPLNDNRDLQAVRQEIEEVMMKVKSWDDEHQEWLTLLATTFEQHEGLLKSATGSLSQVKLDRLCGLGYWISESHLDLFEQIWPHRDYVPEWDYKPRSEYLGDESLENAPLSNVNHHRTDDYNYFQAQLYGFEY